MSGNASGRLSSLSVLAEHPGRDIAYAASSYSAMPVEPGCRRMAARFGRRIDRGAFEPRV